MFLVVGEALIDLVARPDGSFVPAPGGAPYNFARALALQGLEVGYANPISNDVLGLLLKQTLEASGARQLSASSAKPTSLALVVTNEDGQPQYTFYREGVADRDFKLDALTGLALGDVLAIHTGALALVPPDHEKALVALRHFRARGALCCVDINMRPKVAQSVGVSEASYRDAVLEAVGAAHIVKVSDEDLLALGIAHAAPESASQALLDRGCDLVLLTLGARGAWAVCAGQAVFQPAEQVTIADTVGAGDTFFAAFLASLQHQGVLQQLIERAPSVAELTQALRHAAISAAINISRRGCQPPTWDEARHWKPS